MNTYFITGATGVLGSAVVRELLADSQNQLVLLVRAENDVALQKRAAWLTASLGINAEAAGRIDFVCGDVEQEKLGLSPDRFVGLGEQVTHIIHSAASVRMNHPLERARLAAVTAAEHVLQLAQLSCKNSLLKKIEVVSTVGVGGKRREPLPERWLDEPREFHNTYEQSKAEAESVLRAGVEQGMPVTIHRPSMIVGNSQTGYVLHFQIFYFLLEFITGRRTWGVIPDISDRYVDAIPVDYVARVISWSSRNPATIGKILHLCAGPQNVTSLEKARAMASRKFREKGLSVPREYILPVFWFRLLVSSVLPFLPRKIRRSVSVLPVFLNYTENQVFTNTETCEILKNAGFVLPCPDEFLSPVIDHYLSATYSG
ncbi:SDR family oxidoreductase [Nitrosomonas sp.]|uniref:SDR family oxidoreductase n=1 Tax=Nitrosomonas sp. TaxID=42353 RepID=UPI0025D6B9CC|nr:SDR family oxidoreductase [Nitrosomonas sp.]MCC6917080.1 SDR family oxidoreductase [Nitrosomonas sp.]